MVNYILALKAKTSYMATPNLKWMGKCSTSILQDSTNHTLSERELE